MRKNLTVVRNEKYSAKKVNRERNIVGQIHHKFTADQSRMQNVRRYVELETAIPKLTLWLMNYGKVGDMIEISHAITGKWLGTIKLSATGKIVTEYCWEKEDVSKIKR
jgi:hypothetical protein